MLFFSKLKQALFETRKGLIDPPSTADDVTIDVNDEFYNDLLEKFIKTDIGVDLSEKIASELKKQIILVLKGLLFLMQQLVKMQLVRQSFFQRQLHLLELFLQSWTVLLKAVSF